jgi:hypothetical protein
MLAVDGHVTMIRGSASGMLHIFQLNESCETSTPRHLHAALPSQPQPIVCLKSFIFSTPICLFKSLFPVLAGLSRAIQSRAFSSTAIAAEFVSLTCSHLTMLPEECCC